MGHARVRAPAEYFQALLSVGLCGFGGADVEFELLAQAEEGDFHRFAGGPFGQEAVNVVHGRYITISLR